MLKFLFVFAVLAVSFTDVLAVSSEEKKHFLAALRPQIVECSAKHGLTMDDIKKAKESGTDAELDNCYKACVYKKSELIDDHGLFAADKSEAYLKNFLSNEDDQKKAFEIISNCKSVNVASVSDGEKGCERAGLLYECFGPLKAMFQ